jgi:GTP-binding nuclear protein Ran
MSYNILIVGDNKVGKSTFITRHRTGEFITTHIPSKPLEYHTLNFNTTAGKVTLNITETADYENIPFISDIHGAIIMFSLTDLSTHSRIKDWHQDIREIFPDIPIVLCGNKCEEKERMLPKDINIHRELALQYYDLSAKSNYNFEKPFLYLLRELYKSENLCFVETPILISTETKVELEVKAEDKSEIEMQNLLQLLICDHLKIHTELLGISEITHIENTPIIKYKFAGKSYQILFAKG